MRKTKVTVHSPTIAKRVAGHGVNSNNESVLSHEGFTWT